MLVRTCVAFHMHFIHFLSIIIQVKKESEMSDHRASLLVHPDSSGPLTALHQVRIRSQIPSAVCKMCLHTR